MSNYHIPVMLNETVEYLTIKPESWYVDCNLGGGGHSKEILRSKGKVLGIDLDPEAILEVAKNNNLKTEVINGRLQAVSKNLVIIQSNFSNLKEIVDEYIGSGVSGVLFDLGISSHQLEESTRGFSFNTDAPLDMRMNPDLGVKASDLINGLHESELVELFINYGEERFAKRIAKKIVEVRNRGKIETTNQLARIIMSVRPRTPDDRTHPATRVFQAVRIAVNDELNSLREVLPQTVQVLEPGGRLVAISFHSLEDRIIKNFMFNEQKKCSIKILTQKPITSTQEEIDINPRSRSGKLRAAEKL